MLSRVKHFLDALRTKPSKKPIKRSYARLHFDVLETREVPATASGVVTGTAFVDANANGTFDSSDVIIPGASITLTGTTTQNVAVNVSAVTDNNGAFRFDNVLPGTYQVQTAPIGTLLGGSTTVGVVSAPAGVTITMAENLTQNLGVTGEIAPVGISLLLFLNTTPSLGSALGNPGSGEAIANFRPNNTPTISSGISDLTVGPTAANNTFDLAGHFTDADFTDSQVTFHITSGGQQFSIPVTLFDAQDPQTVANFFDYVTSNSYDNSIFHRLVSNFVLQGGGLTLNSAGNNFSLINTTGTVPNEFGSSNTQGTIAMALTGSDVNSATDQFFFNLADNSGSPSNLDSSQFTVFGQVANSTALATLLQLATTPTQDESATTVAGAFPTVTFGGVPLNNYTGTSFPTDTTAANYMVVNDVSVDKRDEFLTYNVSVNVTNGPSNLVVATLTNEQLALSYPTGQLGTATVTVTATDRYGASVSTTFNVTVAPPNQAPVTADGTLAVNSNAPVNGLLVGSDPDAGDTVTFSVVAQPSLGNVTITNTATGAYTYDPQGAFDSLAPGQTQTVTFTYKATDNHGLDSAVHTITVTVTGINHAPVAQDGTLAVNAGSFKIGALVASDVDPGATLTYSIVTPPTLGTVTITDVNHGNFTFDTGTAFSSLAPGQTQTVTFTFKATDEFGADSGIQTITVTVTGV